jgi:glycine/D-amino acid oxidase-like deaminating enzyme
MTRYVVIGGGIAGVCCAQEVARLNAADETVDVLLISATELLKEVIWFIAA